MSVDRAKAIADYPAFCDNAFWQAMLEELEKRQKDLGACLMAATDLSEIYRLQGKVGMIGMFAKLPEDIISRFSK